MTDEPNDENSRVVFMDEAVNSVSEAIMQFLFYVDKTKEEEGWDAKPLLACAHAVQLGGIASLTLEQPKFEDEFYVDFGRNLRDFAAQCLMAEVMDSPEDQIFLNQGIKPSFQGWLLSAEYLAPDRDSNGNPIEERITVFIDVDNNKYGISHRRGEEQARVVDSYPSEGVQPLSVLTAASVMSVVRRNLEENSPEGN